MVWLPWILFPQKYWECHHPNWRTHIFQRGGPTTNQEISTNCWTGDEHKQIGDFVKWCCDPTVHTWWEQLGEAYGHEIGDFFLLRWRISTLCSFWRWCTAWWHPSWCRLATWLEQQVLRFPFFERLTSSRSFIILKFFQIKLAIFCGTLHFEAHYHWIVVNPPRHDVNEVSVSWSDHSDPSHVGEGARLPYYLFDLSGYSWILMVYHNPRKDYKEPLSQQINTTRHVFLCRNCYTGWFTFAVWSVPFTRSPLEEMSNVPTTCPVLSESPSSATESVVYRYVYMVIS